MSDNCQPPKVSFTVAVDTSNGVYTFFDDLGQPSQGGATVTVRNTQLVYTLVSNNDTLIFLKPELTAEDTSDITVNISNCKQIMTLTDSDLTNEDICLRIVVKATASGATFVSPDPKIQNRPQ